jgi:hypothetical protein
MSELQIFLVAYSLLGVLGNWERTGKVAYPDGPEVDSLLPWLVMHEMEFLLWERSPSFITAAQLTLRKRCGWRVCLIALLSEELMLMLIHEWVGMRIYDEATRHGQARVGTRS